MSHTQPLPCANRGELWYNDQLRKCGHSKQERKPLKVQSKIQTEIRVLTGERSEVYAGGYYLDFSNTMNWNNRVVNSIQSNGTLDQAVLLAMWGILEIEKKERYESPTITPYNWGRIVPPEFEALLNTVRKAWPELKKEAEQLLSKTDGATEEAAP